MERQARNPKEATAASTPRPVVTPETKFVEQEWQRVNISYDDNDAGQWDGAEGAEMWECVACGKEFRSEAAWLSHERSRKHLKEVERYSISDNCVCVLNHYLDFNGKC
jgi:DnaJ homolog subfamily A member 5